MKDAKKTILLVEDEAILAMSEKRQLEKYGYAVLLAHSGAQAVDTARSAGSIDIVLMDINLGPGMDGTQAAEIILKDRDIPILFLSSHIEREIVEKTEKITSYGYVVKSSSITVLDASIKMAFKLFEANESLKRSEHKYRTLHESIRDGVVAVDLTGTIVSANKVFQDMLGYSLEELRALRYQEITPEVWKPLEISFVAPQLKEKGYSDPFQKEYLRKDGGAVPVEISVFVLKDENGEPAGWWATVRDIADRVRHERTLQKSKEMAESLLSVAAEIIISEDLEGNVLLLNDSGHRILGYEPPELIGKNFFTTCLPEESRAEVVSYLRTIKDWDARSVQTHDNAVLTKGGGIKIIRWRNVAILGDDGEPVGLFSSGMDIT